MSRTIYDPIVPNVGASKREAVQEVFGRHLIEQRNRMAILVRKWLETDAKFPTPIHNRIIDRVRKLDPATRADVASVTLLMADQIITAVLTVFAAGDEMQFDGRCVNYAVIAQTRNPGSEEVLEEIDVNRGEPTIPLWDAYKRWLAHYASPIER